MVRLEGKGEKMNTWKETGLPFCISDKQITITMPDGQPQSVLKTNANYKLVVEAIKEKRWEDVVNLSTPASVIVNKYAFEIVNDVVYIGGKKVPNSLSLRIVEFAENDLPVEPLLKFWANLELNPSFRAVQQLHDFLEKNNHPLTDDGCFLAYRRVTEDYKDFYTRTMDNSIGTVVSMPRNQVNENPNETCSNGLHVANFEYADQHYNSGAGRLVLVKVNPKDVVAVPTDYNQSKMRVCEFVVLKDITKELDPTPLYETYDEEDEEDEEECNCETCRAEREEEENYWDDYDY